MNKQFPITSTEYNNEKALAVEAVNVAVCHLVNCITLAANARKFDAVIGTATFAGELRRLEHHISMGMMNPKGDYDRTSHESDCINKANS